MTPGCMNCAARRNTIHDLVIVGAGPAGLSAFLQARRQGLRPMVVEEQEPGGALRAGRRIENYPGVPACSGTDLARRMTAHAEALGLELRRGRVTALVASRVWRLRLASGGTIDARTVILATGQKPVVCDALKPLQNAGALLLPGAFSPQSWTGRKILVVGGGDVAFDQALLLLDHGSRPEIVCRNHPRALPTLQEEAKARGLSVRVGCSPRESCPGPPPSVIFTRSMAQEKPLRLEAESILVAVGRTPDLPRVLGSAADDHRLPPGLFLAGDVGHRNGRQAVLAAGEGCAAAISAFQYLHQATKGACS